MLVAQVRSITAMTANLPAYAGLAEDEGSFFFIQTESDVEFGCCVQVDFHYSESTERGSIPHTRDLPHYCMTLPLFPFTIKIKHEASGRRRPQA